MKILIWLLAIFFASSIKVIIESNGIIMGGLGAFVLYGITFAIAGKLCSCVDEEKQTNQNCEIVTDDNKFKNNDSFMKWIHGASNDDANSNPNEFQRADNTAFIPKHTQIKKPRMLYRLFGLTASPDSVKQLMFKDENEIHTELCRYHKKILSKFLILLAAVIVISCGSASLITNYAAKKSSAPAAVQNETPSVYITTSGTKYHRISCQYVRGKKNVIEMSINHAKENGYSPCAICKPENKK